MLKLSLTNPNQSTPVILEGDSVATLLTGLPAEVQIRAKEHLPASSPVDELVTFLTFEFGYDVEVLEETAAVEATVAPEGVSEECCAAPQECGCNDNNSEAA